MSFKTLIILRQELVKPPLIPIGRYNDTIVLPQSRHNSGNHLSEGLA